MSRTLVVAFAALLCLGPAPGVAGATDPVFTPGAPGIGDPYFPLDGNGGYDVERYLLDVGYDPESDVLTGVARIRARATQNLSSLNLDFVAMSVRSVRVDGRPARWSRDGDELTIEPARGLRERRSFDVVVSYDGVPQSLGDEQFASGFVHTDDGALVAGAPDVAATWFPVNDHPLDKAAYTFRITVPAGLEAVANGELKGRRAAHGRTTWVWDAREPIAPYLTTATIGDFDLRSYRKDGIRYWDAIDPDLLTRAEPRSGERFAISQAAQRSYKSLARTISVPAGGGRLSFWVRRDTQPNQDYVFVEAHAVGSDEWTTLPDRNGHTSPDTGFACPDRLELHPFLARYLTEAGDDTCAPSGATGTWSAASGAGDGYEQWEVDLTPYAGSDVEVSISYASDYYGQQAGAFVDDITVPGGAGTTSFEEDGDTMDGWTVPGAPAGSEPNPNDWIAGTADDAPPSAGESIERAFGRQPEIIAFLSGLYGRYPFSAAGGIVDNAPNVLVTLENQTRPIYSMSLFADPTRPTEAAESAVVHELAHQWVGDSLALAAWRHIWLNEGFAVYSEWLWSEHEGLASAQENFDSWAALPADDPFWATTIGDPGPDLLLDVSVYFRGAMTLHALRQTVGDRDFFRILRVWAQSRAGDNVTIDEFTALAERVAGERLDSFFATWLFTAEKPPGIDPPSE